MRTVAQSPDYAMQWVDARDLVQVRWTALGPSVQWAESRANAARHGVAERGGTVRIVQDGATLPEPFIDDPDS